MLPLTDVTTQFLVDLLNIHSPTGYTHEAIAFCEQAFQALNIPGLAWRVTPKGALVGTWQGQRADAPRGVTAHVDTLGLMVKDIKPNGRLLCAALNGIMWGGIEMEGVTVRTFADQRIRGTLVPVNPSLHVNAGIRDQKRDADHMEVRLDERTTSAEQTRALGIEVGDFVFLDPRVELSESGFIRGRFLDDKASVAALYGALLALRESGAQPAQTTTLIISNYEEVGHGGASDWPSDLHDLLSVDMGALGDGQQGDEFSVSICLKDSSGPYHFDLTNALRRMALAQNIPFKLDLYPFYSSDGSAYWRAGGNARVALIGPGVDCSHSYERTHREAVTHSAALIAQYLATESL